MVEREIPISVVICLSVSNRSKRLVVTGNSFQLPIEGASQREKNRGRPAGRARTLLSCHPAIDA